MAEVTKHGRWIHRDADIHRCQKPPYDRTVKTGDIWECNQCKKQWKCRVESDQRDNTAWLTWTEYHPGHGSSWAAQRDGDTSGMYAPGTR